MKEKTETKILVVIFAVISLAAIIALAVGCGSSTETSTTTTITVVPEPVCAVANNQICAGDSAVFYDNNLNVDINYYGDWVEYFYVFDGVSYAANVSIDTFETAPLLPGVYYATLEMSGVDQYGNYIIVAVNCPPVVVQNCQ